MAILPTAELNSRIWEWYAYGKVMIIEHLGCCYLFFRSCHTHKRMTNRKCLKEMTYRHFHNIWFRIRMWNLPEVLISNSVRGCFSLTTDTERTKHKTPPCWWNISLWLIGLSKIGVERSAAFHFLTFRLRCVTFGQSRRFSLFFYTKTENCAVRHKYNNWKMSLIRGSAFAVRSLCSVNQQLTSEHLHTQQHFSYT